MNVFYSGLPRSGKTKAAVIWMLGRLRHYRRPIVTNVALELKPWVDGKGVSRPGLLWILRERYGSTFDAERRLCFLDYEQVRRFYAVRPVIPGDFGAADGVALKARTVLHIDDPGEGDWLFDANKYPACDYIIDEAHVFWPSQGMPSFKVRPVTAECLGYMSQAGRGGDEVLILTQVLTNVNVKLRTLSQECHWFTNRAHMVFGPWRQSDKITEHVYSSTPPGAGEIPLKRTALSYNRWDIESSYDTAKGVGVTGNAVADIGVRARGWPMWTIALIIAACAFGFLGFTIGVKKAASYALGIGGGKKKAEPPVKLFSPAQVEALKRMLSEARLVSMTNQVSVLSVVVSNNSSFKVPEASGWSQVGSNRFVVFPKDGSAAVYGRKLIVRGSHIMLDEADFVLSAGK